MAGLAGLVPQILGASLPYRTEENIPYRETAEADPVIVERCALDLHYPQGGKNLPVIVWFHGGGLTEGKRFIPEELKNEGIVIVAPGYRLSPTVKSPTYVEDAAAAVAWVHKNIRRYGGSPEKIFLSGASAGGYLAAMVGLDKHYLKAHGIDANRLKGLVPLTGQMITHFTIRKERGGSNLQPVIDEMAPLYHIRKDAPPTLVITGDREMELWGRYEENAYFVRMMKVIGHPDIQLFELQGHDHGELTPPANRLLLRHVKQRTGMIPAKSAS
jgi:acetyl esterase/lipase